MAKWGGGAVVRRPAGRRNDGVEDGGAGGAIHPAVAPGVARLAAEDGEGWARPTRGDLDLEVARAPAFLVRESEAGTKACRRPVRGFPAPGSRPPAGDGGGAKTGRRPPRAAAGR